MATLPNEVAGGALSRPGEHKRTPNNNKMSRVLLQEGCVAQGVAVNAVMSRLWVGKFPLRPLVESVVQEKSNAKDLHRKPTAADDLDEFWPGVSTTNRNAQPHAALRPQGLRCAHRQARFGP